MLPPLEESLLRGLMRLSIAVLDSYPVGMHIQVLEAMLDNIPVVYFTYHLSTLYYWCIYSVRSPRSRYRSVQTAMHLVLLAF